MRENMAKPIQYAIELSTGEAERFLEDWINKKPNPARDATIARAKKLNIEVR